VELPFEIQKDYGIPLYIQLEEQIRLFIRSGTLHPGDPMPTVRELAVALGINYNTVARVYRDLQRQGVLVLKRGIGTFVKQKPHGDASNGHDYRRVEQEARSLVGISKKNGLTVGELSQLIELLWKEGT